jgi:hypothetical protein
MGEDHPRIYGGNKPYFDHSSYVVNPKRWEDAVDDTHEVYKPKDPSYNNISIWLQLSVQLSVWMNPWLSLRRGRGSADRYHGWASLGSSS